MKLYRGIRTPEGCEVHIADDKGIRDLPIRHDIRRHSEAFEWNYNGSGPAQLALAICADALQDDERARAIYQRFKMSVVSRIDSDEFTISLDKVIEIVTQLEASA